MRERDAVFSRTIDDENISRRSTHSFTQLEMQKIEYKFYFRFIIALL